MSVSLMQQHAIPHCAFKILFIFVLRCLTNVCVCVWELHDDDRFMLLKSRFSVWVVVQKKRKNLKILLGVGETSVLWLFDFWLSFLFLSFLMAWGVPKTTTKRWNVLLVDDTMQETIYILVLLKGVEKFK